MIQFAILKGSLSGEFNTAIISLLLKNDPLDYAHHWPLSLLNSDINVYTKVLSCHLKPHMTSLVHHDQTGFMKTHLAADNICHLPLIIGVTLIIATPAAVLS